MKKQSIGKVSQIVELPQSVLRYWETVFPQLSPEKTDGGTRRYSQDDIDLIFRIKELLYKKKYTINGARKALNDPGHSQERLEIDLSGQEIVEEIDTIIQILSAKKDTSASN